jgi:hypothetical protein
MHVDVELGLFVVGRPTIRFLNWDLTVCWLASLAVLISISRNVDEQERGCRMLAVDRYDGLVLAADSW